jgi:diguanylate cyclase (GGDEF)-like protein
MLQEVAARLAAVMAGRGFLARMGGDEFAVIGEGIGSPSEAIAFGQEIQTVFSKPFLSGLLSVSLGCTCGFAFSTSTSNDPSRIIDRADMALYRAKARSVAVLRCLIQMMKILRSNVPQSSRSYVRRFETRP